METQTHEKEFDKILVRVTIWLSGIRIIKQTRVVYYAVSSIIYYVDCFESMFSIRTKENIVVFNRICLSFTRVDLVEGLAVQSVSYESQHCRQRATSKQPAHLRVFFQGRQQRWSELLLKTQQLKTKQKKKRV